MNLDPQTFLGAVAVTIVGGILVYLVQLVFQRWANRKQADLSVKNLRTKRPKSAPPCKHWFYRARYAKGLRKYFSHYKRELRDQLLADRWSKYYASLSVLPMALSPADLTLGTSDTLTLAVPDAVKQFAADGLVILGDSGAGKSTSLRKVAQLYCEGNDLVPLLIELRNYRRPDSLLLLMAQEVGSRVWLDRGLKLGQFLLLFDGLNEISEGLTSAFEADLLLLRAEHPHNGVVVTCRPANYTDSFPTFTHMRLLPIELGSIKQFLMSVLGDREGEQLFVSLDERLIGICENPYMLTMLVTTYRTTKTLPSNRAQLYEGFLNEFLIGWESKKGQAGISINVKHGVLSELAFYMANRTLSISLPRAQNVIGAKLIQIRQSFEHNYLAPDVVDELLRNGLIHLEFGNLSFMHQSVQEFYTAREIAERLHAGKMEITEIGQYVGDVQWHETLKLLAGLLPDATQLVNVVRRDNLLFASECVYSSNHVNPKVVDAIIVQALTEFKFGAESFNYPLLFSLKQVEDRRSATLSTWVIDEMTYWCDKYVVTTTPHTLVGSSMEDLLKIVSDATNSYMLSDAIWTLGTRKEVRVVNPLINILLDKNSPFRIDAARALGKIGDKRATSALLSCTKESNNKRLIGYCFNALGSIGDHSAFQDIIKYISDINNTYRDSAGWALRGIASSADLTDEAFGNFLLQNTHKGTPYERAIFIYLLGQFKIKAQLSALIELMRVEREPFIKEEISFTLGEYQDKRAFPILLEALDDEDALVQTRAAQALGKIDSKEAIPKLGTLLTNENEFVRESAKVALSRLSDEQQGNF